MKRAYCDLCRKKVDEYFPKFAYVKHGEDEAGLAVTVDIQFAQLTTADPDDVDICEPCFKRVVGEALRQLVGRK